MSEVGRQATPLGTDNDPDAPQLSLDGLLRQLVSQAEDVMAAHERLRALLAATEFLLGTAEIPVALRRITEAARSLVGAGYAGLGILTPSGEALDRIVTADGAEPRPLPLPPRTCRGPELHVPLYVRNRLFGYLHLSDGPAAGFTADDEEVVTALAATGGVVIENAQLFDEAQRRQRWLEASGSVTRQLLAAEGEDPLTLIAREARVLADADVSSVVRPAGADGERLVVAVASGLQERELRGVSFDAATSLSGRALTEGRPVLVTDAAAQLPMDGATVSLSPVGPAMALPLRGTSALLGTLVLARNRGRRPFDAGDLEMATAFASQAAVAVELADARADQHRMAVLEDRDRIARTLHDQVIQRLFATGLSVQGIAGRVPETEDVQGHQNRLHRVVSDIDDTIRQIRTSVFELESGGSPGSARSRLLAVVADAERVLPVSPSVIIDEGVELLAGSEALLSDVVAVLREGLTNVARHARATAVDVQVRMVDRSLQVQLTDDGIGIGASGRRSGLGNLRQRALARRGTLVVGPAPESGATSPARPGTRLVWTVPVT